MWCADKIESSTLSRFICMYETREKKRNNWLIITSENCLFLCTPGFYWQWIFHCQMPSWFVKPCFVFQTITQNYIARLHQWQHLVVQNWNYQHDTFTKTLKEIAIHLSKHVSFCSTSGKKYHLENKYSTVYMSQHFLCLFRNYGTSFSAFSCKPDIIRPVKASKNGSWIVRTLSHLYITNGVVSVRVHVRTICLSQFRKADQLDYSTSWLFCHCDIADEDSKRIKTRKLSLFGFPDNDRNEKTPYPSKAK